MRSEVTNIPSAYSNSSLIRMMPQDRTYGSWAASGEIDIFEGDGSKPQFVSSALHFGGESPNNKQIATSDSDAFSSVCPKVEGVDLSEEVHDYVLVWSKDKRTFMVDTKIQWEVDLAKNWGYEEDNVPWDQPFYFIFNVAVGGEHEERYDEPLHHIFHSNSSLRSSLVRMVFE